MLNFGHKNYMILDGDRWIWGLRSDGAEETRWVESYGVKRYAGSIAEVNASHWMRGMDDCDLIGEMIWDLVNGKNIGDVIR